MQIHTHSLPLTPTKAELNTLQKMSEATSGNGMAQEVINHVDGIFANYAADLQKQNQVGFDDVRAKLAAKRAAREAQKNHLKQEFPAETSQKLVKVPSAEVVGGSLEEAEKGHIVEVIEETIVTPKTEISAKIAEKTVETKTKAFTASIFDSIKNMGSFLNNSYNSFVATLF